jgi:transcriptional regulator with XRE-family HTH domain
VKIFARRLKEARSRANITQVEMAQELGIPFTTYRNYETLSGANREPEFETLTKIADVLDVTTDYLLGRE